MKKTLRALFYTEKFRKLIYRLFALRYIQNNFKSVTERDENLNIFQIIFIFED